MIELEALSAGYTREPVIKNISARFKPGEVCAIIGANGSGKSTLLKVCCGLIGISAGNVLLDGEPLAQVKRLYTRIAYLQQDACEDNTSVADFIIKGRFPHTGFPARYTANDREVARVALERFNLVELSSRPLSRISGGERRRAELAQIDAQDCEYIFMDEPASFLDAACSLMIGRYVRELRDNGRAVIIISHDINQACGLADKIVLMHAGEIAGEYRRERFESPEFLSAAGAVLGVNITRGIFYGFT